MPFLHLNERRGEARPARRGLGVAALLLLVTGCGLYTLGGPGHGTRFEVPPGALVDPDPVTQSWIAYSLAKGTCQLARDGERPSHHDSFECELRPREVLVRRWLARDRADAPADAASTHEPQDAYLDRLAEVEEAGFLSEYVWVYLSRRGWTRPEGLRLDAFAPWRAEHLRWHRPKTRLIGWWSQDDPSPP